MTSRSAIGLSIAAALAYIIADMGVTWMAYLFAPLAFFAVVDALTWIVGSVQSFLTDLREADAQLLQREMIAREPTLILAEMLRNLSPDAIALLRLRMDDPGLEVLPGFTLLTREFVSQYLAACETEKRIKPQRDYSEGTAARLREQVSELHAWLIFEGYALQTGRGLMWAEAGSLADARNELGI